MCLTMLAGCGQKGGSGSAENTDKEAGKSEDKEVLSMMLNGSASDAYVEGYQKIIDEFNKQMNLELPLNRNLLCIVLEKKELCFPKVQSGHLTR